MMKKFLVFILFAIPVSAFAQSGSDFDSKGKTEFYAGYGLLSAQDVITGLSNVFTGALLPGMVKRIDSEGFGTAFGGVDYYIGNRFTVGLQFNYASFKRRYRMEDESTATLRTRYRTILLRGKGIWVNKSSFQLYSALAVGPTFVHANNDHEDTRNNTEFAFQASPIGIRVGNHIAFFLEAGFGYQGMISGGLSARL